MNELEKKFDLVTFPEILVENNILTANIEMGNKEPIAKDFDESRKNLSNVIQVGSSAVDKLGELANMSQDPNYFMALSRLISSVSDATSALLRLHEQKDRIIPKPKEVNTNFTTAEIKKLLKKEMK